MKRRRNTRRASPRQTFGILALVLVAIPALFLREWTGWPFYWAWLVVCNLVTLAFYGFDKAQSKSGGLRVPEVVLHGLGVAGGFVAGWLGRAVFRHKTCKPAFVLWLAVGTALHLVWIIWRYV
ncbi:MAG: DUF1294 domain-containing protein [Anaerolineae bacterium]|nr:DUF1294 domain-containing protein [Anaerolineae bacterium]